MWTERCEEQYDGFLSNCQNFAAILKEQICIPMTDPAATQELVAHWKPMPWPVSTWWPIFKVLMAGAAIHLILRKLYPLAAVELGLDEQLRFRKWFGMGLAVLPFRKTKSDKFRTQMNRFNYYFNVMMTQKRRVDPRNYESWRVPQERYRGYHPDMVNDLNRVGFPVDAIVAALQALGIGNNNGFPITIDESQRNNVLAVLMSDSNFGLNEANVEAARNAGNEDLEETYLGYNKISVDKIARSYGFSTDNVLSAFLDMDMPSGDGREFSFTDEHMALVIAVMRERQNLYNMRTE